MQSDWMASNLGWVICHLWPKKTLFIHASTLNHVYVLLYWTNICDSDHSRCPGSCGGWLSLYKVTLLYSRSNCWVLSIVDDGTGLMNSHKQYSQKLIINEKLVLGDIGYLKSWRKTLVKWKQDNLTKNWEFNSKLVRVHRVTTFIHVGALLQ